ncbi:hypothetical protein RQP46_005710 [Phenoliferia psychrophenolica]
MKAPESSTRPRSRSAKAAAAPKPVSSSNGSTSSASKKDNKDKTSAAAAHATAKVDQAEVEEREKRSLRGARTAASARKQQEEEDQRANHSESEQDDDDDDDDEGGDGGITRCVCSEDTDEMSSGLMIQCDMCKCWQHGPCVGLWNDKDCPDRYFCELCRPGWHGPGGLLRKAHRKAAPATSSAPVSSTTPAPSAVVAPPATTAAAKARSPSAAPSRGAGGGNKPRESADAALVAAFLAAEQSVGPSPGPEDHSPKTEGGGGDHPALLPPLPRSPSAPAGKDKDKDKDGPAPKKRSTMNSRDAAYDDAIAMSILGPGSAAMRARLEKAKGDGDRSGSNRDDDSADDSSDHHPTARRSTSRESSNKPLEATATAAATTSTKSKARKPSPTTSTHSTKRRRVSSADGTAAAVTTSRDEEEPPVVVEPAEPTTEVQPEPMAVDEPALPEVVVEEGKDEEQTKVVEMEVEPPIAAEVEVVVDTAATAQDGGPTTKAPSRAPSPAQTKDFEAVPMDDVEDEPELNKDGTPSAPSAPRAKHPNQYTYRPKGGPLPASKPARASPTKRVATTRVKFPNKRMTLPEMKKRARTVLEFLSRYQVEASERDRRNEALKAALTSVVVVEEPPTKRRRRKDDAIAVPEGPVVVESMMMMDDLTKALIMFQQRFISGCCPIACDDLQDTIEYLELTDVKRATLHLPLVSRALAELGGAGTESGQEERRGQMEVMVVGPIPVNLAVVAQVDGGFTETHQFGDVKHVLALDPSEIRQVGPCHPEPDIFDYGFVTYSSPSNEHPPIDFVVYQGTVIMLQTMSITLMLHATQGRLTPERVWRLESREGGIEAIKDAIIHEGGWWMWMRPDRFPVKSTPQTVANSPSHLDPPRSLASPSSPSFQSLPTDILISIATHLPLASLTSLSTTCHQIRSSLLVREGRDVARSWLGGEGAYWLPVGWNEIPEDGWWNYVRRCVGSGSMRNRKRIWGVVGRLERLDSTGPADPDYCIEGLWWDRLINIDDVLAGTFGDNFDQDLWRLLEYEVGVPRDIIFAVVEKHRLRLQDEHKNVMLHFYSNNGVLHRCPQHGFLDQWTPGFALSDGHLRDADRYVEVVKTMNPRRLSKEAQYHGVAPELLGLHRVLDYQSMLNWEMDHARGLHFDIISALLALSHPPIYKKIKTRRSTLGVTRPPKLTHKFHRAANEYESWSKLITASTVKNEDVVLVLSDADWQVVERASSSEGITSFTRN